MIITCRKKLAKNANNTTEGKVSCTYFLTQTGSEWQSSRANNSEDG